MTKHESLMLARRAVVNENMDRLGHHNRAEEDDLTLEQVWRAADEILAEEALERHGGFKPNTITIAAMKEARQRRALPRFNTVQELFDELGRERAQSGAPPEPATARRPKHNPGRP